MRKLFVALALTIVAGIAVARAQTYPSRPVTLIVPFPPGGSTDVVGRIIAERSGPWLGQPLIIENVGGAGGSIALGRCRPLSAGWLHDRYRSVGHACRQHHLQPELRSGDRFRADRLDVDQSPTDRWRKDLPVNDLELVAWMKANPGTGAFANQTVAAQTTGILLQKLTGQPSSSFPTGAAARKIGSRRRQSELEVAQPAVALPQVRAGTRKHCKPLAATLSSDARDPDH